MRVTCPSCGHSYDDAARSTICPHGRFMSAQDLTQKDAGLALIGKDICFAHEPAGPVRRVQSVGWNGMVTIAGMAGEFAPHLFVLANAREVASFSMRTEG